MASKTNNKKSPKSPTPTNNKKHNEEREAKKPVESTNRPQGLTVVGIGASAGGLTALNSFFDALHANTGMAFVVVTHLHPEHESHMAEILQNSARMPVTQVSGLISLEGNHVYVIPPNHRLVMA